MVGPHCSSAVNFMNILIVLISPYHGHILFLHASCNRSIYISSPYSFPIGLDVEVKNFNFSYYQIDQEEGQLRPKVNATIAKTVFL